MKRLPISGSASSAPERSRDDLAEILRGAGVPCDETATEGIHFRLGAIIGSWWQQQASMETEPVAKALFSLAKSLQEVSQLLSMYAFHAEHGIQPRHGRGRRNAEGRDLVRWCFDNPDTADDFALQFGARRLIEPMPKDDPAALLDWAKRNIQRE